jgi:hypothetical protein
MFFQLWGCASGSEHRMRMTEHRGLVPRPILVMHGAGQARQPSSPLQQRDAAMTTKTPEQTPAGPNSRHRHTLILLAILLTVAIPLITVAIIWPTYGAGCAITVGLLINVLQSIHDRHHPNNHPQP